MGLYPAFAIQIPKPMFREPSLISGKLFQALIKIYVRLVIAQSIQLSNIVLADLHQLPASAGMGLTHFRPCTILKFLQPNVRRQATFYEPGYGFGRCIDAQHQTGTRYLASPPPLIFAKQGLNRRATSFLNPLKAPPYTQNDQSNNRKALEKRHHSRCSTSFAAKRQGRCRARS